MTPPAAATVAARRAASAPPAHRRAAPARPHRRISGPVRPPRPVAVPRRPARTAGLPLGARALARLRALPEHRLLDRLIGGRVWIVLLGTLLVGIVTLQLTLLRLNAGIGRAIEQSSALQQSNASLRLELSQLSDADRVMALASQMGYVMPPQGSPRFLAATPGDAARALATMRVPDPSAASIATSATSGATSVTPAPATTTTTTVSPTAGGTTGTSAPAGTQTTQTQPSSGTATGTTTPAPAAATTTPAASVPAVGGSPAAAGGASAPVGGQG